MSEVTENLIVGHVKMCNSIGQFIDEQKNFRELAQNLAQQIQAIRNGTHPSNTIPRLSLHELQPWLCSWASLFVFQVLCWVP